MLLRTGSELDGILQKGQVTEWIRLWPESTHVNKYRKGRESQGLCFLTTTTVRLILFFIFFSLPHLFQIDYRSSFNPFILSWQRFYHCLWLSFPAFVYNLFQLSKSMFTQGSIWPFNINTSIPVNQRPRKVHDRLSEWPSEEAESHHHHPSACQCLLMVSKRMDNGPRSTGSSLKLRSDRRQPLWKTVFIRQDWRPVRRTQWALNGRWWADDKLLSSRRIMTLNTEFCIQQMLHKNPLIKPGKISVCS